MTPTWMMAVVITKISCVVTAEQESHSRSPYSPLKHQQCCCLFILSALEYVSDLIPQQNNKSTTCLTVRWRCLCCLVKMSGLRRIREHKWRKKKKLNQESHHSHCYSFASWLHIIETSKSKIDIILIHESVRASLCYSSESWLSSSFFCLLSVRDTLRTGRMKAPTHAHKHKRQTHIYSWQHM